MATFALMTHPIIITQARIIYVEDVATAACASDEGLTAAMALSRQGNAISVLQWTGCVIVI
eukprot:545715-Amphidinium_carterae.1